jgi:hypothetical protein
MSDDERKSRRKEINRLAARKAHQKKLHSLAQLEEVNTSLKQRLAIVNTQIRAYEAAIARVTPQLLGPLESI